MRRSPLTHSPLTHSGIALLLIGLIAAVVGTFTGCGSLFTWNGRHAVDVQALPREPVEEGRAITHKLVPEPGRRYTLSIQVVFDREGLSAREGVLAVEAQLPLVVRVKDPAGTTLAEASGWLDPNMPPNVLYGQAARVTATPSRMPELVAERLVGPFIAASDAPLSVEIHLGADRIGTARILERRLVVHDDAMPTPIKRAFIVAGAGVASIALGVALIIVGFVRTRRSKRVGIRKRDVV